jgi:hypothetical protein
MNKDMKKINLSFEVNEDSFNLLKTIDEMGSAQYRDHEWDTLEEFKKSDVFLNGTHTEEWFLTRNFFGTFYLIDDLFEYGLVEIDGESWHLTYFVTNLGKTVLNNAPDVSDSSKTISVDFAKWIAENKWYKQMKYDIWEKSGNTSKSTSELFDMFIENYH